MTTELASDDRCMSEGLLTYLLTYVRVKAVLAARTVLAVVCAASVNTEPSVTTSTARARAHLAGKVSSVIDRVTPATTDPTASTGEHYSTCTQVRSSLIRSRNVEMDTYVK